MFASKNYIFQSLIVIGKMEKPETDGNGLNITTKVHGISIYVPTCLLIDLEYLKDWHRFYIYLISKAPTDFDYIERASLGKFGAPLGLKAQLY